LGELLAHLEYLEAAIARLSARIADALQPYATQVERLRQIAGINREAAEMLLAEIGLDMRCFPSAAHLASWADVCPGNHESAGKRKTGRTRHGNPWLKTLLVECGWGAGRARRIYVGAQYVRLLCRRGAKKAALAVGHSILVAAYHRRRDGVEYRELGPEHVDRLAAERLTRHYVRRLEQLGHRVMLEPGTDVA
jgi:transposase